MCSRKLTCRSAPVVRGSVRRLGIEDKGNPFDLAISPTVTQSGSDSKLCTAAPFRMRSGTCGAVTFSDFLGLTNESEQ